MDIVGRRSRARAVGRPRGHRAALNLLHTAVKWANRVAPYARAAGAKTSLGRKIGQGLKKRSSISAISGRVQKNLSHVTNALASIRAARGVSMSTQTNRRKYVSSNRSGAYSGNYKLPNKKPKSSAYDLVGVTQESEVYGTNTMKFCNYVGFQSLSPTQIGRTIGMAFLRHVMYKFYGIDFATVNDTIWKHNATGTTEGRPISFGFFHEQSVGTITNYGSQFYNITAASTVAEFGNWFSINVFMSTSFGGGGGTTNRILKYLEIYENQTGQTGASTSKMLYLDRLIIQAYSVVKINVQNSTVSDGASKSTDVIDANPITGKMFNFNSLAPMQSQISTYTNSAGTGTSAVLPIWDELQQADSNGIVLPPTDPPLLYRTPPRPSMFIRLKSYGSVNFEPGETKSFQLKFSFRGTLNYLMQNLAFSTATALGPTYGARYSRSLGNCLLFALEKRIKGDLEIPIVINYHVDTYTGAKVVGLRRSPMIREVVSNLDNNDPV